ncbi:MAG TPA: c-type cytochrome [Steroidobacteraceae bacterium]|nr:c-type cytochrome [Steroidobacteraceae bacterium]
MSVRCRWLLGAPLILAGGCASPQNYVFGTAGPAAAMLARLGWQGLIAFMAAALITIGMIVWLALRRRGSLAEHEPIDVNQGQSWILIGGFAIPFAVLAFLFVSTVDTLAAFPMMDMAHQQGPDIIVTGRQWWFRVDYPFAGHPDQDVTTATEIHVPIGRPMTIELQTDDVIHSFWVPKLHGKVDLIPGQKNFIRIQADRPGTYLGECAKYCGEQHAHMRLMVVAQAPQAYEQWLAAQRAAAADPSDPLLQHGQQVFLSAACPLCHTVRGTLALGQAGPELTHIGSRLTIAGGSLPNNTGNLAGWVTDAQTLKPGAQMPNLATLDGQDLRALVAYLQSLK